MLTADDVHDAETLQEMLKQIKGEIDQVTGDGAYDTHDSYQAAIDIGAKSCFPPRELMLQGTKFLMRLGVCVITQCRKFIITI